MAELQVLNGPLQWKTYKVMGPRFLLGRKESCHLVLKDGWISREHTVLVETAPGEFMVQDLDSENGIYVNGQKVKDYRLRHDDILRVGRTELRFYNPAPDESGKVSTRHDMKTTDAPELAFPAFDEDVGNFDMTVHQPGLLREPRADLRDRLRSLEKLLHTKEEDNTSLAAENAVLKRALAQGGFIDPGTGQLDLERMRTTQIQEVLPRRLFPLVWNPMSRMAFPTPTGEALIPGGDGDLSVGVYRLGLIGAGRAGVNLVDAFYRTGWHHGVGIAADPDAFEDKALDAKARIRLGTPSEGTGMRGVERVIGDQQFAIASALVDAFGSDRELILIAAGLGGVTGVGSVPALLEVLKEVSSATRRDERPPPPVGMLLSVTPRRLLAEEGRVSAAEEGVQTLRRLHDGGKLRPFILVEPDRLREFVPGEDVAARRMRDATVAGACDAVNRLPLLRPLRGEVDADAFRKAVEGEGLSSIGLSAATGTSAADLEGAVRHALGKGWLCGAVAPSRGLVAAVVVVIGSEDLAGDAGTLSRLESAVGIAKGILPQARLSTGIYEDDGKGVRIIAWVGGLPFPESLVS